MIIVFQLDLMNAKFHKNYYKSLNISLQVIEIELDLVLYEPVSHLIYIIKAIFFLNLYNNLPFF
jgi:hypothetical protein